MFSSIMKALFGSKTERDVKSLVPIVEKINAEEAWASALSKEAFLETTASFKKSIASGTKLEELLPKAYALSREASKRVLGERPYDVQLMGSIVLNSGKIVEMKTGEGKTLMCVAAAYLNSLTGKGVHIVTVNDYLAERDAEWMRPVYEYLGVSVGIIVSNLDNEARKKAYNCDITYGTNNEFGFDYLRDNMQVSVDQKVQRGFAFCIVDEIDSILIDEARTPLIISGQGEDDTARFFEVDKFVHQLVEAEKDPVTGDYPDEAQGQEIVGDYKIDEKSKRVSFTDQGMLHIEEILQKNRLIEGSLFDEVNFEYIHYFTQAVRAHKLYKNDVDYVVKEGQVQIVDEFTGRILEGRRYGDGLHQAIEAKEKIRIAQRNRTLATITFQNFFRMYEKLSGMTGTADTEAVEFSKIYKLDVVVIPTNKPIARIDDNDEVYLNEHDKWEAIAKEIKECHAKGQPILVGTVSIEKSELLSALLTKKGIRHEVLNAKNHAREALIIAEAGAKGSVTIATNMAGRGTDIKLGGNAEFRARKKAGTEASAEVFAQVLAKEKESWKKDYEEVKAAGGLYVIGTERHESRRIDNQLRGRSGRQGDPGRSKFFISMDDDLMRLFGGERMKTMMKRIGMPDGEAIFHPWLTKGIEKAQTKVELRNFEIRKHLLDYDDVLNEQRNYIYAQRDAILNDDNLRSRVMTTAEEVSEEYANTFKTMSRRDMATAFSHLQENLKDHFNFQLKSQDETSDVYNAMLSYFERDLNYKEALAGKENLNMFIRYQYVQAIDRRWLDHLEQLEALREAVYLRSYGSKNPLTEYKIDGFNIFYDMLDAIRLEIASRVFKVRVQTEDTSHRTSRKMQMNAQHNAMQSFDGMQARQAAAASPMASKRQGDSITVVRSGPKVGRNDPCPCGSGKKYKQCCGR
ncbi:MAG TPA: preprotein translocase subunit SecA [Treponemataceae bacterium]|jgi:preprotein translocase subunit SecA|nr:preprotein translocase subunit SecA [Spirochaetota bacterium]NMA56713.1 preprotein translocase subunit SecA [Treponema sp.]HOQ92748.1 preprotein translocase subunit SecA [Treponemataceae bacterium]